MIKGLVRVFVSLQKENVVILFFFKKKKKSCYANETQQIKDAYFT